MSLQSDPRFLTLEQRRALRAEIKDLRTARRKRGGPFTEGENARLAELKQKRLDFLRLRSEQEKLYRKQKFATSRDNVGSNLQTIHNSNETNRVSKEVQKKQAETFTANYAPNSDELGKENAGFKALTESTKPKNAKLNKPEPAISEMQATVPNVTVTKAPATKSNVDTLAGATTAARKNLNKVIASASPTGIQKTLEDPQLQTEYTIKNSDVATAVKDAQDAVNDPVIQTKMKDIGLSQDDIDEITGRLEDVPNLVNENQAGTVIDQLKNFATTQFRSLSNPFGAPGSIIPDLGGLPNPLSSLQDKVSSNPLSTTVSNKVGEIMEANANGANPYSNGNPFGSLGVDFGNILASVTGLTTGTGTFKELGKTLESFAGGVNNVGVPVPDVVTETGVTQISKAVNKGTKTAANELTTPVYIVGQGNDPQELGDFTYEKVNSKKEFELELKTVTRAINNLIVDWTLTAENKYQAARSWQITWYQAMISIRKTGIERFWRSHYFIRKDGIVERMLPLNTKPLPLFGNIATHTEDYKKFYDESIRITFDAGLLGDDDDRNIASATLADSVNMSSKSITSEQWKSFDMMADVIYRHVPGGLFIGQDQLMAETEFSTTHPSLEQISLMTGPGFDVDTYLQKKREIINV